MTRRELHDILEPPRYTRTWWLARGRNALWVLLVTLLVWIYADVEYIKEEDFDAAIELAVVPGRQLVLLSKNRVPVHFRVRGRRSSIDRFEQWLGTKKGLISYTKLVRGTRRVSTGEILSQSSFIENEGLAVLSASPRTLSVRVDEKIHKDALPVKFDHTGAFFSDVVIDPPTMGIRVAASGWEKITKADPAPALRTVRVELNSMSSDKPFPVQIVRRIGDVPVEPDEPTVMVKVKIAQLTETEEITVPVQLVTPTNWLEEGVWKEYVLTRQTATEWRAKIQVSGTRKDLDQLQPGDVQAFVVLTEDDKKPVESWLIRQVEVRLPARLSLSLVGTKPSVSFKLEKLPAAAPL